jgi:hypothetical protein
VNKDEQYYPIPELARTFGIAKQSLHKIVKRLRIETSLARTDLSRGQLTAHISSSDLAIVAEYLQGSAKTESPHILTDVRGWFYLIQLEPQADPKRFKLGFAMNPDERLRSHKTSAPFAVLLKVWPCKALWEKTAIECVTQEAEKVHTEVFRADDLEKIAKRADAFFALMPTRN